MKFNPDRKETDPRMFQLFRVQHTQTKLYWSGKGFDEKNKAKSILVDYRLMAALKWEHIHVNAELIVKDRRDDKTWIHLVPKTKALSAC